jgi:hypothetical protein
MTNQVFRPGFPFPILVSEDSGDQTARPGILVSETVLVNASGGVGTVTVSAPAGSVSAGVHGTAAVGTVTVSAPTANVTRTAHGSAAIGTVTVSAPAGSVSAGVHGTPTVSTVTVSAPAGNVSATAHGTGAVGTVTVSTPTGNATGAAHSTAAVGIVSVSAPAANVTATAHGAAAVGTVSVSAPAAHAGVSAAATGAIGTIAVSAPSVTASAVIPITTNGQTGTFSYTGSAQTAMITASGLLTLKLWAGAGAGGSSTNNIEGWAGGAGYTFLLLPVTAGDVLTIDVGGGGLKPSSFSDGGSGGWPDGGAGGIGTNVGYAGGGGGGSTRVYLNGTLVAVAGASGGGCGAGGYSGVGGGTTGGNASSTSGEAASQTAGGLHGGGFLQGGSAPLGPTTQDGNAGGGGGGGYYGGGAYYGQNGIRSYFGGGGGSGWLSDPSLGFTTAAPASSNAPANATDAPSGVGVGGISGYSALASLTDGGNGAALYSFSTTDPYADGVFGYTGGNQTWTAPADGVYTATAWGGAGSGPQVGTANGVVSGAGGRIKFSIPVLSGDVITVQVGQGGQVGAVKTSWVGGYPDGGASGLITTAGNVGFGAGGGSTRIYLNGVLVGVAAAGGGAGGGYSGGPGGGTTGGASGIELPTFVGGATGGTQTAGGASIAYPTDASSTGGSLQGGNGWVQSSSSTSSDQRNGAGGGGGYFGGGGGTSTTNFGEGGGGGGSSWVSPSAITSSNTGATGATPADPDSYLPIGHNFAQGQPSSTTAGNPGGNGFVVQSFIAETLAFGNISTLTVSYPTASALAAISVSQTVVVGTISVSAPSTAEAYGQTLSVPLANITLSAPGGHAGVPASASGAIGNIAVSEVDAGSIDAGISVTANLSTITVANAPGTAVQTSATIVQPLLDYSITVSETPTATAAGAVSVAPNLATITVGNVTGLVPGATWGNIGTVSVITPTVYTSTTETISTIPTISVAAPIAGLSIGQSLDVSIGTVSVDVVDGFVSGDEADATGDLGTSIGVSVPEGAVSGGQLYIVALADPIVVSAPDAASVGNADVTLGGVGVPTSLVISTVSPSATVAYGQDRVFALPDAIEVVVPTGIARQGATVHVPVSDTSITVSAPDGTGGQAWSQDVGDIPTITVSEPDANALAFEIGNATAGAFSSITVSPAAGGASQAWTQDVGNISTVTVSVPDAGASVFEIGNATAAGFGSISVEAPVPAVGASAGLLIGIGTVTVSAPAPSVFTGTGIPASTSALLPSISIESPESWVADGMPGKLWFKRSATAGNAPDVLASREIALNEVDGIIFFRDPGGDVSSSSYLTLSQGAFAPDGGSAGDVLLGNGTWGAAPISYDAPVRAGLPKTAPGELIVFSNGSLGFVTAQPALNEVLVQPFFVAKPMTISTIGVKVVLGAPSMAAVSICPWDPVTGTLGAAVASGTVDCADPGEALTPQYASVGPGWFASTIELTGSSAPTLDAAITATTVDADFNLTPELAFVVAEIAA